MQQRRNERAGENGESPENTRRLAASSSTISMCETPEATLLEIEPINGYLPCVFARLSQEGNDRARWWHWAIVWEDPGSVPGPVIAVSVFRNHSLQTKDEVDRARWLRTTNPHVPTLNCTPANTFSDNRVVWISAANLVQFPAGSPPDVRMWASCRTMLLVGGFSQGSLVCPALSFRRSSILTSITLIDSQDLAVTCHHTLFTHSAGNPC
ncbi:hypothetical protein PR048_031558 [Dryococelus australis]|uniref:Uncharacterized protein n=1 Tax=Dryococelus australis TaxID=614101 RepID=A0ABQ9G5L5_9NEOP|nr:hypothetical protein PR048_031558 [Dryococelus australis]